MLDRIESFGAARISWMQVPAGTTLGAIPGRRRVQGTGAHAFNPEAGQISLNPTGQRTAGGGLGMVPATRTIELRNGEEVSDIVRNF